MNRSRAVFVSLLVFLSIAGLRLGSVRLGAASADSGQSSRTFEFNYQVHLPATLGAAAAVHLWIP